MLSSWGIVSRWEVLLVGCPCIAGTWWSQPLGSEHSTIPSNATLPLLVLLSPQAASIHPCQHANVMHKLSERVAGESGEGFQVDR